MKAILRSCLLLALLAAGCSQHKPATKSKPDLPPASVELATASLGSDPVYEQIVGTVRPRTIARVSAKVSGRITELQTKIGKSVKKGDLLAEIDAAEIDARLDQAEAALSNARRELDRYQKLLEQKAVTQSEFDSVETRHQIAAATVLEARTMLGYTRVEAPFDGLISRQLANAGDLASPGKPLLELESKAGLRFEADVAEALVGPIRIGDPLSIAIDGIETSLQGAVAEISPAANPLSRTVPIKLDLPPNPSLRAGQFGRLSLPVATSSNILVPARSVIKRGQMEIVFVADAGKAVMRLVKTGRRHGEQIEILSGIENREKVVASGHQTLRDGQPIVTP